MLSDLPPPALTAICQRAHRRTLAALRVVSTTLKDIVDTNYAGGLAIPQPNSFYYGLGLNAILVLVRRFPSCSAILFRGFPLPGGEPDD